LALLILQFFLALIALALPLRTASVEGDSYKDYPLLAKHFGDHMILQRDRPIPLWGCARPQETISVSAFGHLYKTRASQEGTWEIKLPSQRASIKPEQVTVQSEEKRLALDDILIGDVFLCAGQSNILMARKDTKDCAATKMQSSVPLRIVNIGFGGGAGPYGTAKWTDGRDKAIDNYSAVGTVFAEKLAADIKIPVGIVQCAVGGTAIRDWIDPLRLPEDLAQDRRKMRSTNAYKTYLQGLPSLPARGMIWYQGESDFKQPETYLRLFTIFARDMRCRMGEDTPIFIVQLPALGQSEPYYYDSLMARFREAQTKCQSVGRCYYISTLDVVPPGSDYEPGHWIAPVHLPYKREIGEKLANLALSKIYDIGKTETPQPYQITILKEMVEISISGCGRGLKIHTTASGAADKDNNIVGFTIAGRDRRFHLAKARIVGNDIIVHSDDVPEPAAVRYLWADNAQGSIYTADGLALPPFRTDTWLLTKPYARYGN